MEITVTDKNAYQNYLNSHRIIAKLQSGKIQCKAIYMLAIGVIVALVGFLLVPSTTTITKINHATNRLETSYEDTTFNLIGSLGVAYVIMTLLGILDVKKQQEKEFTKMAARVRGYYKYKN